ncbi:beta-N-acetylhexosaminidase [Robertkochia sp. 1368]|nr:beta-N-acetylhexosaminidase [Robertkochia sediminum]
MFVLLLVASFSIISCTSPYADYANVEDDYSVIPIPDKLMSENGRFLVDDEVVIVAAEELSKEAGHLSEVLAGFASGMQPEVVVSPGFGKRPVMLLIDDGDTMKSGGYELIVKADAVVLIGADAKGVFYGIQTLRQLLDTSEAHTDLPSASIPAVTINDSPRFSYRGMHLDVARHFQPVSFVKRYIDLLAMHKFNTFHWHLTEDQGWRIEIKKYPELTEVGAWRNGTVVGKLPWTENDNKEYGGFYTQEEIKEIVAYAADRHITVIPEIEMPGHSSAAIAAYPELSCFPDKPTTPKLGILSEKSLEVQASGTPKVVFEEWGVTDDVYCAGKESTFEFLEGVLEEVIELFPSTYIHIGGDECPKGHWDICENCKLRMQQEGLADVHELQSYFITRMEKYLNKHGRQIIGWDEILEGGLAPNATVMSWRGVQGGIEAAKQGHNVIMTPGAPLYFDHYQADPAQEPDAICCLNTVESVYGYEPVPEELSGDASKYVLGAQGNVWTEYMKDGDYVEYMVLPRMAALSEVLWSRAEAKDFEDFKKRMPVLRNMYEQGGYTYAKHMFGEAVENEE